MSPTTGSRSGGGHSSGGGDHDSSGGSTGGGSHPPSEDGSSTPPAGGGSSTPPKSDADDEPSGSGPVPSHDKVSDQNGNGDGDDDEPVPKKSAPSGADSGYSRRLPTYRPSYIRGPKETGVKSKCRLNDRDIDDIGSIEIEGTSDALKGASWSEGVADYAAGENARDILQNFYFGMPNSQKLDKTGSCAVFFTNVTDEVAFVGDENSIGRSCESAMNKKCVDAMLKRALDVKTTGDVKETCERLGSAFKNNLDSDCAKFAGKEWSNLVVKSIPEFLEPKKRLKKDAKCWPADEQADLTLVASVNRKVSTADVDDPTRTLTQYGIMPILTLFYPGDGELLSKAESHFTCIKPVAQEESASSVPPPASENNDPDSAGVRLGVGAWDSSMLILTLWLMMALFGMKTRSR